MSKARAIGIGGRGALAALLVLAAGSASADAKTKILRGPNKDVEANGQGTQKLACPPGLHVVGGGAYTSGASLEDEVADSAPYDSGDNDRKPDDGWTASLNAGSNQVSIRAYAVCSDALALTYKSRPAEATIYGGGFGMPNCPNGMQAVGGGMTVKGKSTASPLKSAVPHQDGGSWVSAALELSDPEDQGVAHSICSPSNRVQYAVSSPKQLPSQTQGFTTASCPEGTRAIGGGGGGGSFDSLELATLAPEDGDDEDDKPDDAWITWVNNHSGDAAAASIGSRAVCFG